MSGSAGEFGWLITVYYFMQFQYPRRTLSSSSSLAAAAAERPERFFSFSRELSRTCCRTPTRISICVHSWRSPSIACLTRPSATAPKHTMTKVTRPLTEAGWTEFQGFDITASSPSCTKSGYWIALGPLFNTSQDPLQCMQYVIVCSSLQKTACKTAIEMVCCIQ